MTDIQELVSRHLEDLGARLPGGVAIPDEAEGAIRGTILAAIEEALSKAKEPEKVWLMGDLEDVARAAERTAANIRASAEELKSRHPSGGPAVTNVLLHMESRALDWEGFAVELRRPV